MGNRAFRYVCDDVHTNELQVCSIHAENGDEIGLSPRQLVITRTLRYRVTPRQRQCVTLYYGRGLTQQQIADALGISASTVSRNIAAGVQHVSRELEWAG